jgi:hypothetical protein
MSDAKAAEVFIEISERWRQRKHLDAGRLGSLSQCRNREVAGRIVIADDIKAS